jgi:transcriptional regulator with XRE-family HTH domain
MDINARLTRWREHKGMTKSSLAAAAETTPQAVDRIEAGDSQPSLHLLERLVDAMSLTMAEFYGPLPKTKARAS